MTWIAYRGVLSRIDKLRRFEKGEGQSVHERLEETLAEKNESAFG